MRLVIGDTERISNRSVDPRVKNYHWLDFEQALLSAYDSGGDNVVLPDDRGLVTEGAGFNVFVVRDGVLEDAGDERARGHHATSPCSTSRASSASRRRPAR